MMLAVCSMLWELIVKNREWFQDDKGTLFSVSVYYGMIIAYL